MPTHRKQLKRYEHRNDLHYLTCSCYQRLPLFKNDMIKDHFAQHIIKSQNELHFKVYAWVLMPDHFHLLVQPKDASQTVEPILRNLKASFAQKVIRRWSELNAPILGRITDSKSRRSFWQRGGGYDRNIYCEEELLEKIRYIHLNPVRQGIVSQCSDWKWSSARWYEQREDYVGPNIAKPL